MSGKRMLVFSFLLLMATIWTTAAAQAQELTAEEKFNALVEKGIFEGFPDG